MIKVKATRERKKGLLGSRTAPKPPKPLSGAPLARHVPILEVKEDRGNDFIRLDDIPVGVASRSGSDQSTFWTWKGYRSGNSPSREEAVENAVGFAWSLVEWCKRQWAWSDETFGPDNRTKGIVQHIKKELKEVEKDPQDLEEWVDVMILAMDGFRKEVEPLAASSGIGQEADKEFRQDVA